MEAKGVKIDSIWEKSKVSEMKHQLAVPSHLGATAVAMMVMCALLIGLGIGPHLVAWLGATFSTGTGGSAPALALVSISMLPPSTACLLMARKAYTAEATGV